MDVERIESLLRAGPPAEPRYMPVLAVGRDPVTYATRTAPVRRLRAEPRRRHLSPAPAFMAIALVVVVAGAGLLVRSLVLDPAVGPASNPSPSTSSPSPSPVGISAPDLQPTTAAWSAEVGAGVATALVVDERIHLGGGSGMHATRLVRLGSVTKLYVAGAVLQLVDEGQVSLDDPLAKFVTDWPNGDTITIRMLLNGSSGVAAFGEPLDALERRLAADPARSWNAQDALAIARTLPPRFEPGERVSPIDTDDALLVAAIERVTGATASAEIRRRFLDPFALRGTYAAGEPVPPPGSAAYGTNEAEMSRGHQAGGTPGVVETVDDLDADVLALLGPARGMAATVGDVARWSDFLHHKPDLLSDASRALLGLSYERGGAGGAEACPCVGGSTRAVVIGGPVGSYSALVAWFPERQATIAILTDRVVAAADMQTLLERLDALVPSSPSR